MIANRLVWFTTPEGRKFMQVVAGTAICGAFGVQLLPNTIFLEQYRDLVAIRRDKLLCIDSRHGKPLTLTPELKKRYEQVLHDVKLSEFHKNLLEPFMVFGYDIWHAGSLYSQGGAIIGLPVNFTYKKAEDIDKSRIIIYDDHVNWNRNEAKSLLQSLVLSENAQKFAIAREVFMVYSQSTLFQSIINSVMVGFYYVLSSKLNDSMAAFEKPRVFRLATYLFTGTFLWGVWIMQRDGLTRYYENRADEQVSELGLDYIKGGVEYYNKIIQRNIALRTLIKSKGERMFTKGGNEKVIIRQQHIPNSSRKQFFEEKLKEYEKEQMFNVENQNNTAIA